MPPVYPDLNDSTPAAPDGHRNTKWQAGGTYTDSGGIRRRYTSDYLPNAWGATATKSADYTPVQSDSGKLIPCNGTFTVTLPTAGSPVQAAMFGSPPTEQDLDYWLLIENIGSGTVTVSGGGCQIDGSPSTVSLSQNQGIIVRVSSDGLSWVTFRGAATSGGGLSNSNFVDNEVVSFSGTSGMLANTPVSGSVKLYRNGQRMQSGAGNDYTISGAVITLAVAAVAGDIFLADYRK